MSLFRDGDRFHVKKEQDGADVILRPVGDVDLSRSPVLRCEIMEAQKKSPQRLIVDLAEVPYMDSSGVATLLEAWQIARRQRGKVVLCNLQEKVKAIIEIARLETVFTIVKDCEEAKRV
jgi:anti-sigma B factor antagonist